MGVITMTLDNFMLPKYKWLYPISREQFMSNRLKAQHDALKKIGLTRQDMINKANAFIKKRCKK